jgi:hypothetical protein
MIGNKEAKMVYTSNMDVLDELGFEFKAVEPLRFALQIEQQKT